MGFLDAAWRGLRAPLEDGAHVARVLGGSVGARTSLVAGGFGGVEGVFAGLGYAAALALVFKVLAVTVFPLVCDACGVRGRKLRLKFSVALRELTFYSFSCAVHGTLYAAREPWVWDFRAMWEVGSFPPSAFPREMRFTYLFEMSWYAVGILYLLQDLKKKDFAEMFLHHCFTVFLIGLSYHIGHLPVGILVIMLHTVSDIPLQFGKLVNYKQLEPLSTLVFATFALAFAYTRLWVYPQLVRTAQFDGPEVHCPLDCPRGKTWEEQTLIGVLAALIPLHCFWLFLILRMAYRLLVVGVVEKDVRESSDDDEDDEDAFAKPPAASKPPPPRKPKAAGASSKKRR